MNTLIAREISPGHTPGPRGKFPPMSRKPPDDDSPLQRNIRRILDFTGESARHASLAVGTNDSLVKAMLDGRSQNPRSDKIGDLAGHWGITRAQLIGDAEITEDDLIKTMRRIYPQKFPGEINVSSSTPTHDGDLGAPAGGRIPGISGLPTVGMQPKDLRVLGTSMGGDGSGEFYFNGDTVDWAHRPPALMGAKDAFAVWVESDSMSPVFHPQHKAYVHPGKPVAPGCYVLVELHAKDGERNGPAYIKELVRRGAERVVLRQLNPPKDLTISTKQIKSMYFVFHPHDVNSG